MPQAQETHQASNGQGRPGQQQGKRETAEEGGFRCVEGKPAHGCGGDVNLAARDIGTGLRCAVLLGWREGRGLPVPVGQDHAGADGSEDGQSHGGADLAAGIEQA